MNDDEYGRVPAGWYPDPLGLPQLRWWDNHAWTEHVSDARQPVVPHAAAPTTFADDELPEPDEVEPAGTDGGVGEQPMAEVLRELEPPHTEPVPHLIEPEVVQAAAAEADVPPLHAAVPTTPPPAAPGSAPASAPGPTSTPAAQDAPFGQWPAAHPPRAADTPPLQPTAPDRGSPFGANPDLGGWTTDPVGNASSAATPFGSASATQPDFALPYGSASGFGSAANAPRYAPVVTETPLAATRRRGGGASISAGTTATAPGLHTVAAWAIALLPMLQLLLSLLVVAAFTGGQSVPIIAMLWLAPYPIVIVLALIDARGLRSRGVDRPASALWALLSPPVYLIARAVRLSRFSGAGFGPAAVFLLLGGLQAGAVIAVPGLVIGAVPQLFAAEASNSIELNARSIGSILDVTCPDTPPLFIGQQFRCPAESSDGTTVVVTASLQRSNGWIAWQVDDWGIYTRGG